MSNAPVRINIPGNAPMEFPKVVRATVKLVDAAGGVTHVEMEGKDLRTDLNPPRSVPNEEEIKPLGRPRIERGRLLAGGFTIAGVEQVQARYEEPERPKQRWQVGDIVRLPKWVLPAGHPYRTKGWIAQLKHARWLAHRKVWAYQFEDLAGRGLEICDSPELDGIKTLDRWPLRRGDFVKVHEKHGMGDEVFKLTRRVGPGDKTYFDGLEAWWIDNEAGPTGTWLKDEDAVLVDDVKVVKTVKWERG